MGWLLRRIPKPVQLQLLLRLLVEAVDHVDPAAIGKAINTYMDNKFGKPKADDAQAKMGVFLDKLAKALRE